MQLASQPLLSFANSCQPSPAFHHACMWLFYVRSVSMTENYLNKDFPRQLFLPSLQAAAILLSHLAINTFCTSLMQHFQRCPAGSLPNIGFPNDGACLQSKCLVLLLPGSQVQLPVEASNVQSLGCGEVFKAGTTLGACDRENTTATRRIYRETLID